MKSFPHEPEAAQLEELRQKDRAEYQALLAGIPKAVADRDHGWLFSAWRTARNLASLEYAFDSPLTEVQRLLEASCQHAERALDLGHVLNPTSFGLFLCIANICKEDGLRDRLEQMNRSHYTDPGRDSPQLAYLVAEIVADLSADRPKKAAVRLSVAIARAQEGRSKYAALVGQVLIAKAILNRDSIALDKAIETKIKAHASRYAAADVCHHPGGLLDLFALGMARIAQRYDLAITVKSIYLPLELLST
jgi:Immunity protein 49